MCSLLCELECFIPQSFLGSINSQSSYVLPTNKVGSKVKRRNTKLQAMQEREDVQTGVLWLLPRCTEKRQASMCMGNDDRLERVCDWPHLRMCIEQHYPGMNLRRVGSVTPGWRDGSWINHFPSFFSSAQDNGVVRGVKWHLFIGSFSRSFYFATRSGW